MKPNHVDNGTVQLSNKIRDSICSNKYKEFLNRCPSATDNVISKTIHIFYDSIFCCGKKLQGTHIMSALEYIISVKKDPIKFHDKGLSTKYHTSPERLIDIFDRDCNKMIKFINMMLDISPKGLCKDIIESLVDGLVLDKYSGEQHYWIILTNIDFNRIISLPKKDKKDIMYYIIRANNTRLLSYIKLKSMV